MAIIPGKTYYLKLTANYSDVEMVHGWSFTTEDDKDIYFSNNLIEVMHEWPPTMVEEEQPRRCGECAHLRAMEGRSYNTEAYKRRPWGDCAVYAQSEEYKSMVENHVSGCGWRYAPGRYYDQPACPQFKAKRG